MIAPMIRKQVKQGSIFKVWIEPLPDGAAREYKSTVLSLGEPGQAPIWKLKGISLSSKASPVCTLLHGVKRITGDIQVVFAGDNKSAKVWTRVFSIDSSGNEVPHGKPQSRIVSTTAKTKVINVLLLNYMA